jgi:diguanylate cyclase (GGDEF)-like protein
MQASPQEAEAFTDSVLADPKITDPSLIHCARNVKASFCFERLEYRKAEDLLNTFLFDYYKYPFYPFYISAFSLMGMIKSYEENNYIALFYFGQAERLSKKHRQMDELVIVYADISLPYIHIHDYQKGIVALKKAIALAKKSKNKAASPVWLGVSYYNLADMYKCLGQYKKAEELIAEAETYISPQLMATEPYKTYLLLAHTELDYYLGKIEEFRANIDACVTSVENCPAVISLLEDYMSLAEVMFLSGDYAKMELFLSKLEELKNGQDSIGIRHFLASLRARYYAKLGDYQKASLYLQEENQLMEETLKKNASELELAIKLDLDFAKLTKANQEVKKQNIHLKKESDTDSLTGVPNRHAFNQDEAQFNRAMPGYKSFGCALIDFDSFKSINDTFGHLCGDKTLKGGGKVFAALSSEKVRIYRFGGDEFVVLLLNLSDQEAEAALLNIQKKVSELKITGKNHERIDITVSIGYVNVAHPTKKVIDYLDKADQALYETKRKGKDSIAVYGV